MENLRELITLIQVISIAAGVVISILSLNDARKSASAARQLEAARPFLQLRQTLYFDAAKQVGVLANPDTH
jgi:hypothetical protein